MQGIGNDFVVVNASDLEGCDPQALARSICDRRLGVGADGLLVVGTDPLSMTVFNADGSSPEMCGNGLRCVVRYAFENGHGASRFEIQTGAGLLKAHRQKDGRITIDMGAARLKRGEIGMTGPAEETFIEQELVSGLKGTAVSMGNPHLVVLTDSLDSVDLEFFGPRLENHPLFPDRVNVHYVQVETRDRVRVRTWERGAGITLACGTGACAVAVACHKMGLSNPVVEVFLPGGQLQIEIDDHLGVKMTGEAVTVFTGTWSVPGLEL